MENFNSSGYNISSQIKETIHDLKTCTAQDPRRKYQGARSAKDNVIIVILKANVEPFLDA